MSQATTRILSILSLLRSRQTVSSVELASRLGVTERTVRRYVQLLEELGFVIERERGRYGGYRLGSTWVPNASLSDDEIVALIFGLLSLSKENGDLGLSVLTKLESSLSQDRREQLRALFSTLQFTESPLSEAPAGIVLIALGLAAQEGQRVRIRYRSPEGDVSERGVDPYGLVYFEEQWYLVGHCHLRQARRLFRLDRIASLRLLESTFQPPPGFDARVYLLESMSRLPGRWEVAVLLETTLAQAQRMIPQGLGTLTVRQEDVLLECSMNNLNWLARLLVSLDCPFTVQKPDQLRVELEMLAATILQMARR